MTKLNEMSYGELIEHVDDVIRALRIKAYGEGYEQGRFEQRLESDLDVVSKEVEGKPSQERRDEIIEQAKGDVEVLKDIRFGMYTAGNYVCTTEFIVNKDKRTVVALLRGVMSGSVRARGIAKCLPNDCFNVHIGKAIALRRALGLEVPYEYLNAPQPSEARVGDIIQYAPTFSYRVDTVCGNVFDLVCIENGESYGGWVSSPNEYKIIDDSREGVTE